MNKKIVLAYVISAAVYIVTMLLMSARANTLLNEFSNGFVEGNELQFSVLSSIQKPHTTVNIVFFVALLGFALYLFAKGAKKSNHLSSCAHFQCVHTVLLRLVKWRVLQYWWRKLKFFGAILANVSDWNILCCRSDCCNSDWLKCCS